jgi:hypothetical protein
VDKLQRDVDYFTHRVAEAERQALSASTSPARLAYAELARLYRERLATLQETPDHAGGLRSENMEMDSDGSPLASSIATSDVRVSDADNGPLQGSEAEKISVFAQRLSDQFGENAISVVRRQIAAAEHGGVDTWDAILAHLLDKQGLRE